MLGARALEPIPYGGIPCSALMQGVEALFFFKLMFQAVLTPHGRPCTLEGVDGVLAGMGEVRRGQN